MLLPHAERRIGSCRLRTSDGHLGVNVTVRLEPRTSAMAPDRWSETARRPKPLRDRLEPHGVLSGSMGRGPNTGTHSATIRFARKHVNRAASPRGTGSHDRACARALVCARNVPFRPLDARKVPINRQAVTRLLRWQNLSARWQPGALASGISKMSLTPSMLRAVVKALTRPPRQADARPRLSSCREGRVKPNLSEPSHLGTVHRQTRSDQPEL